jgi:hypothetical protein
MEAAHGAFNAALVAGAVIYDEYATMRKLGEGFSIARFGDGEAKLMRGADALREPRNAKLAAELIDTMQNPHERCLRGVLIDNPKSPKRASLARYVPQLAVYMGNGDYYSAHISRADHAPWMETAEYAELAHALWRGKRAVVVAESELVSTYRAVSMTAREVVLVPCPHRETYAVIDSIESAVVEARPEVVVMAAGPAATCLANRLSKRGIQALDFGRIGSLIVRNTH